MSNKIIIFCSVVSISIFCLFVISMTYTETPAGSQPPSDPFDLGYVPGELLVRFAPKTDGTQLSMAEKNQIMSSLGEATVKGTYRIVPGLSHVKLPEGITVEQAIKRLSKTGGIMYAQPNHYLMLCSTPDDPKFGDLWGMNNTCQTVCGESGTMDADIDAPEAWDIETDASEIIVAVIDSGVDYTHEDLKDNMWINPGEDHPPLGVVGPEDFDGVNDDENYDNEGNPLIDDLYGYDFCTIGTKVRDSDPMDDDPLGRHGTLMAGVIGAVGNNGIGVTGVCWKVKIMALRSFLNNTNFGEESDAIACIQYAIDKGAKVISNSWGRYYYEQPYYSLWDAIASADENGILFIAAVNNFGDNVDKKPFYPACYSLGNIISVMSTDYDDYRAVWWGIYSSNYGATSVDLAAPGTCIWSCVPPAVRGVNYEAGDGTSMSTPYVSGACALVWATNPLLSHVEVKGIILNTVDKKEQLENDPQLGRLCVTGGRLNLNNALLMAQDYPTNDTVVGWWAFDEGVGQITEDWAGDNDGILGDPPRDPERLDVVEYHYRCLDFDIDVGEDDEVSLSPIIALMSDSVTVSAWVKPNNLSKMYNIISQYTNSKGYRLLLNYRQPMFCLDYGAAMTPQEGCIDTGWHHLAGTYDGSALKIYVDGVLWKSTNEVANHKGTYCDAYIGYPGYDTGFDGKIDDVRVYNYPLNKFQIWDVMSGDLPRFRIKNNSDETVAWFDSFGNLMLKGEKLTDAEDPIPSGSFILKKSNEKTVAYISNQGNLWIDGSLSDKCESCEPTSDAFIIKNPSNITVGYIKLANGDLCLTGKLNQNPEE